ncbi:YhgE/Pip domain-containing protein [Clostridium ihumii]|uniref:YhgE/Pip domain-containing protein n=1 Tax=Clostridium ihumii TaxID=1470356 RepID=UPI00058EE3BC|nr:YhgE/Pip domain-containing protein [Clostridium ihumii]
MKQVFKIFKEDLMTILKNTPTLIIIIGLCIIPSLYAWVNIKACWDPYAGTSNVPVAIVNKDEGATLNDKVINVGNDIVESLKENDSIGWVFIDEWQGNFGLNEGKYYALIEIPSNFSKGLMTLATPTPQKPSIIYKANEKANAIATKITNAAKGKVTDEIRKNFVSTVNEKAFETLNKMGVKVDNNKPKILELKDVMTSTSNNIAAIKNHVQNASENNKSLESYLNTVKNDLPLMTNQINNLQQVTQSSKELISSTQKSLTNLSNNLSNDIIEMQNINNSIQSSLNDLRSSVNDMSLDNARKALDNMWDLVDSLQDIVDRKIDDIEALNDIIGSPVLDEIGDLFRNIQSMLKDQKTRIEKIREALDKNEAKENINTLISMLSETNSNISNKIGNLSNKFFASGLNVLNSLGDQVSSGMDVANSMLDGVRGIVPGLSAVTNFGISSSKLATTQTEKLSNKLTDFQTKVDELSDKTKDLNDKNIDEIVDIMSKDSGVMASFISSPIEVERTEIYETSTFGVGLTPFYTTLAIWVGVLLLSSMLTTECEPIEGLSNLSLMKQHFGKMLTYLAISLVQTIIVVLGDKYILGVKPDNFLLMIAFAILASITFVIIMFTLVVIIGNIGKAIAVFIMVMQIAGSGGLYPIQTNPRIFGILQPLWPFTYVIDGFRQAIAGPVWSSVRRDVIALIIISVAFLLLGLLRKPLHKAAHLLEHKFKESGL